MGRRVAAVLLVLALSACSSTVSGTGRGKGSASGGSFHGVSVAHASDLTQAPIVHSHGTSEPAAIETEDLVVGKGPVASRTASVTVQYVGVLYRTGVEFDSSWKRGEPTQFSLQQVIAGFTTGIAGSTDITPMHVGGRRVIIIPPADGYGSQAAGPIPANSTLVFVVDLKAVS